MARVFTITEGLENMGAMKTGGQGSVYKGRRTGEVFTAIKILPTPIHSESADDKNYTAFMNEVQKLKKVNEIPNPNVVKILSSGITGSGNLPFIEMEYIEGPDLEELVQAPNEPVFSIREVLKVAEQLSNALAHCHKQGVKHGDIKSNNVKFNAHTGNYMLLDFGLAIMSDEQRRSSLRQAGAIEFMAPEQSNGQMLFETDVYSFGVVLFELLAGRVPFPLNDKGETARNQVMVAHMEKTPPDLMVLRREALPATWDGAKQQDEMQMPQWLIGLVYKCLEKNPSARFANGMELHDHIVLNSIRSNNISGNEQMAFLQQEINKLRREKEQLQQQLQSFQLHNGLREPRETAPDIAASTVPPAYTYNAPRKERSSLSVILALLITAGIIAAIYYFMTKDEKPKSAPQTTTRTETPVQRPVIGEYIVTAQKAFFYNEADENTRRSSAYAIPSSEVIKSYDERNGFIYTEIVNSKGQTSKGWLRRRDLVPLAEWNANNQAAGAGEDLTEEDISIRLNEARLLLNTNKTADAVKIYKALADKGSDEASYQYANLALQNKHNGISCSAAFNQLVGLSNKGFTPAKRTVGFLYSFADDDPALLQNNYDRCNFVKDVARGSKLLMEAILTGDTAAQSYLDALNAKTQMQVEQPNP